jgi:hypothetical protein
MKHHKVLRATGLFGALAVFGLLPFSSPVTAESFPGINGRLIFSDVNGFDLKNVKPDGTDRKDVSASADPQTDAE